MMNKIIIIKYGELNTKKGNLKFFVDALYKNIYHKLKDDNVNITKNLVRTFIELKEDNEEIVINKLQQVFGIHSIGIAYRLSLDIEQAKKQVVNILAVKNISTFKVETKRSYKGFPYNSIEINNMIGEYVLSKMPNIKVDVHKPDFVMNIEIRSDYIYLYIDEIKGLGGYPNGIQGKGILMLSGGIDSPVAGYLALKRGIEVECIYFDSPPYTSVEALNKVIKLCEILSKYTMEIKLHIVPFTKLQETIYKNANPTYIITIMRRMMYRISEEFVKKQNAHVIINGESVGQVASQTLMSMTAINSVTNFPIIRPLACFDKLEIIDIAKTIDTYETSILPYEDCCTIFVPPHPVINPTELKCLKEEQKTDYKHLIEECLTDIKTLKINNNTNKTSELL